MKLRVKKVHPSAILSDYASAGAACFDLHAIDVINAEPHPHDPSASIFRTGLAFEVPDGWAMVIYSRSGHGFHRGIRLSNCVGVIDSDYRGEVKISLRNDGWMYGGDDHPRQVKEGERIAQAMLIPVERIQLEEVDELTSTARGTAGFGSTGA